MSPPGRLWAQAKEICCRSERRQVIAAFDLCHRKMPRQDPCYCKALERAESRIQAVSKV